MSLQQEKALISPQFNMGTLKRNYVFIGTKPTHFVTNDTVYRKYGMVLVLLGEDAFLK